MASQFTSGRALIIAVAKYAHIGPLPDPVLNDARDLADLLRSPTYCGYRPENVHMLLNQDATSDAIRRALGSLAGSAGPDDTVVLFFSGHGGQVEHGAARGTYLLPVDCDPRDLRKTAIESEELTRLLRQIGSNRLAVLLDACHAGGAGELKQLKPIDSLKTGFTDRDLERLGSGIGRVILASSRADEVSRILPGMKNSLFTHHLLAGLRGAGHVRGDGLVRIFDVFHYVADQVQAQAPQHPVLKAHDVQDNFPLALYMGGRKGVSASGDVSELAELGDAWWRELEEVAAELFTAGPTDAEVWSRAGGDVSRLRPNLAGRPAWHAALRQLRQGGGSRAMTVKGLLTILRDDFPNHQALNRLAQAVDP